MTPQARFYARSASDKTDDWPAWFVADRQRNGRNVTADLTKAKTGKSIIEMAQQVGSIKKNGLLGYAGLLLPLCSRKAAIELADWANSSGFTTGGTVQ